MQSLKRNSKVRMALAVGLLALVSLTFLAAPHNTAILRIQAAGNPDAYGNFIHTVKILQSQGGVWVLKGNLTVGIDPGSYEYFAGGDISIDPCNNTRIYVRTFLYRDFAISGAQALTRSRVFITIAGEGVTDVQLTKVNGTADGSDYRCWHYYEWNPDGPSVGVPLAGASYAVSLHYEAYFDPNDYGG